MASRMAFYGLMHYSCCLRKARDGTVHESQGPPEVQQAAMHVYLCCVTTHLVIPVHHLLQLLLLPQHRILFQDLLFQRGSCCCHMQAATAPWPASPAAPRQLGTGQAVLLGCRQGMCTAPAAVAAKAGGAGQMHTSHNL